MNSRPRVIIVVAYGSAPLLVESYAALSPGEKIITVDNSSSRDVRLASERANAEYIDPGENLGFAAGVNLGISAIKRQDVDILLLNPDATISSNQIDLLQAVFERKGNETVGCVSPALKSPNGSQQRVLWPFPTPAGMWREALGVSRFAPRTDQFAVGAVLLLRREAIAEVGLFDERYFLYSEETDWQRRASARGWRSVVASDLTAHHIGGATSTNSFRRETLSHAGTETYIRRWFGTAGWTSYRLAAVIGALARSVVKTGPPRRRAWDRACIYFRGPRRTAGLEAQRVMKQWPTTWRSVER